MILLSARAGEESRVEGLNAGADDYLVKPFTARELKARVATHVKMANLRREAANRDTKLLGQMLGQAPAGIGLLSGPEYVWTYVNEYYVRMTGRSDAADFLGKTLRDSLPELETQEFRDLLDEVYRTEKPYVGRELMVRLDRTASGQPEEAYFDFVYQPVRNPEGGVGGILVHSVEVTEKVMSRRAVEESAKRLRLAQAAAKIGSWEWDPGQGMLTLSQELHRIFGTDGSDSNYLQILRLRVHAPDWPKVQQCMEEGYRLGNVEFEFRCLHPELGLRWLYCQGLRIEGDTRMTGILQDVTSRKSAEAVSQRLAAIVESSDDAIISKDLNGIVKSWNPAAEKIFGYRAEEMIGESITKVIPPELLDDEATILATIARGERIEHFETVRLKKNGERFAASLTVSPVKDEMGNITGAAKIARDITQQKRAENALRTTERLASVGRLAATVAHEINNPLEALTNLIYLAKNAAVRNDVRGYLADAEEELARISELTKQTLGFYRETRGVTNVRLGPLTMSLLSVFSSRAQSRGIELRPEVRDDTEFYGVPGEIRQVVANLVSNSIDAVNTGGVIRIRVSAATQWKGGRRPGVRLTVGDTGSGIPKAARPQIFEPFFTTKSDVGTGLGLWVCKNIVENHGGSIQVRSSVTPEHSWTVFSVFLPLNGRKHATGEMLSGAVAESTM